MGLQMPEMSASAFRAWCEYWRRLREAIDMRRALDPKFGRANKARGKWKRHLS